MTSQLNNNKEDNIRGIKGVRDLRGDPRLKPDVWVSFSRVSGEKDKYNLTS